MKYVKIYSFLEFTQCCHIYNAIWALQKMFEEHSAETLILQLRKAASDEGGLSKLARTIVAELTWTQIFWCTLWTLWMNWILCQLNLPWPHCMLSSRNKVWVSFRSLNAAYENKQVLSLINWTIWPIAIFVGQKCRILVISFDLI